MDLEDCFNLGYIAKLHGYKGEVSLFLDVTDPSNYGNLKSVFIEINKELIPFPIDSIKLMNKGFATIKFRGIDTENKAKELLRKSAYLPLSLLPQLGEDEFYDHEIISYNVIDIKEGFVGVVEQVIDLPSNPLLQLKNEDREILIPIIPGLVKKVNRTDKQLEIQAPEGLLELYR